MNEYVYKCVNAIMTVHLDGVASRVTCFSQCLSNTSIYEYLIYKKL